MTEYQLKLYITGSTIRSEKAIGNLRRICEESLDKEYELVIVDVLDHPQLAEDNRILATPTVVRESPEPKRRVIGDLSDREQVLFGLDCHPGRITHQHCGDDTP